MSINQKKNRCVIIKDKVRAGRAFRPRVQPSKKKEKRETKEVWKKCEMNDVKYRISAMAEMRRRHPA